MGAGAVFLAGFVTTPAMQAATAVEGAVTVVQRTVEALLLLAWVT